MAPACSYVVSRVLWNESTEGWKRGPFLCTQWAVVHYKDSLLLLVRSLIKALTEIKFCLLYTLWKTPLYPAVVRVDLFWANNSPQKDLSADPRPWALHVLYTLCLFLLIRGLWNLVYSYTDLSVLLPELASPWSDTFEGFRTCPIHTLPAWTKLCLCQNTFNAGLCSLSALKMQLQCAFQTRISTLSHRYKWNGMSNASRAEMHLFTHRHRQEGQENPTVVGWKQ